MSGNGNNAENRLATLVMGDNALVRAGLTHILSGTRFTVVNAPEAAPALCLIDASGSSERALEMVTSTKSQHPLCKITLIESQGGIGFVQAAISAGVDGFCAATGRPEVLIKSLELVMLGEKLLPSPLIQALLSQAPSINAPANAAAVGNPLDPRVQKLSARERAILQSIMGGDANKVIARKLDVAEATVKVHVKAILRKVGVANRTQAAMWAAVNLTDVRQPAGADTQRRNLS